MMAGQIKFGSVYYAQQIEVTLLFFPLIPPASKRLELMLNQTYTHTYMYVLPADMRNIHDKTSKVVTHGGERAGRRPAVVASLLSLKNKARNRSV
jgi:hypothetical protein